MNFNYPYNLFWGKLREGNDNPDLMITGTSAEDYHPLICHMIDTAMVVQAMWDDALPLPFKLFFSTRFNVDKEKSGVNAGIFLTQIAG